MISEAIITSTVSGVALTVFQSLWKSGGKALGLFNKTVNDKFRETVCQAAKHYGQNYLQRHGILKVLGMKEPVFLESLYTTAQFLEEDSPGLESISALEAAYRQSKLRSFQSTPRSKRQGLQIANDKPFLVVLGGPGTGKSTFLRRVGLEALKGSAGTYQHPCIPVFIELKEFRTGDIHLERTIVEEFRICGFPDPQPFTQKALEQGNLLILLDGLDEVPTDRLNEILQQIQNFVDLHHTNRFIISCRPTVYRHNLRRFTDVTMAEFDDAQIQDFILHWFRDTPEIGEDCWRKLNSKNYQATKELTQTPLLLTLVCLLYQKAGQFPTHRATLYEKALRVLLEEWAGEKGIPQEPIYKGLDTRLKETLLSEIAYSTFVTDRLFFTQREIAHQIQQFLEEILPHESRIDGEAVLKSIAAQHGILVKRAEGIYSFSHLTLQEYLTAQYIDDHRQSQTLVQQYLNDDRWQEVFLLVAGLMRGGADDLLMQMEQQALTNLQSAPKIQQLLQWATQITSGNGPHPPSAQRAIALYLALAFTASRTPAVTSAVLRARSLDLKQAQALDITFARTRDITLARTLGQVLIRILALTRDLTQNPTLTRDLALTFDLARDLTHAHNLTQLCLRTRHIVRSVALEHGPIFTNVDFNSVLANLNVLQAKAPANQQRLDIRRAFVQDLQHLWLDAFHLNAEWVDLSTAELNTLAQYLGANHLILQCHQSAIRVSRQIWAAIEARMLKGS